MLSNENFKGMLMPLVQSADICMICQLMFWCFSLPFWLELYSVVMFFVVLEICGIKALLYTFGITVQSKTEK